MKFLILFVTAPVIFAQPYEKNANPNDEPFLPIYPQYPYNPKLIKRGIEQVASPQLAPELYAPKVDARDSYSASFSNNYPRESYYPTYDTYSKSAATSALAALYPSAHQATTSFPSTPYSFQTPQYNLLNSYPNPFTAAPAYPQQQYPVNPYQNYYYQPPYYPNYYNAPFPPPPPPPPNHNYPDSSDSEEDGKHRHKTKKISPKKKNRESDSDTSDNDFVDGANYIIATSKDLEGQSSSYKTPSPYNQLEHQSDGRSRNLPKATYKLVSVVGSPPATENQVQETYIKMQQLEQLMRQALNKLLAQNAVQQTNFAQVTQQDNNQNYYNKEQQYIISPTPIAKTGLQYVVNPTILNRVPNRDYSSGSIQPSLPQTQKYGDSSYVQKPLTRVTLEQSTGLYIPPTRLGSKDQTSQQGQEYVDYDSQQETVTSRNHEGLNYQNRGLSTAQTPQVRNYPFSTYRPTQRSITEDLNVNIKQKSKA